jgi:hypothetical protein
MKISKWWFLVIFWILAILFLLGEFLFLKWRKERLYSSNVLEKMMLSLDGIYIRDDVCDMNINAKSSTNDLINLNIFCKNGKIGTILLGYDSTNNIFFENLIKDVFRLTNDTKILLIDNWVCKDKDGKDYNFDSEIGEIKLISCYEK